MKTRRLIFPKNQDDVLKCLVLSTAPRYSVYCHRGGERAEYLRSRNQRIFLKTTSSLKKKGADLPALQSELLMMG